MAEDAQQRCETKNNNCDSGQMIQALSALQSQLDRATNPSAYIQGLPDPIKRRLKALKKLQSEAIAVESKFFEELHNLECKYENLYRPFMDKRYKIVSAEIEPDDNECQWPSEDEGDSLADDAKAKLTIGDQKSGDGNQDSIIKGIPEFWLRIFKNVDILSDMLGEQDEPILRHLQDIRVKLLHEKTPGFLLEFVFSPNDYFTNAVLTKEYTLSLDPDKEDLLSYEGPEIVKSTGCTIDWKEGKNVTLKKVQKTQRRKGQEAKRTVTKIVRAHSFFNFFNPPQVPEGEDPDEDTDELLSADYEVGHFLRDRVVPKAVLYFTGEALDEEDEEEYDDEEGEEHDSEEGGGDSDDGSDQDPSQ